jgi:hypothetical protein
MANIEFLFHPVQLSRFCLSGQNEIWKPTEEREEVNQCGCAGLIDDCKFAETIEELLELRIITGMCSPSECSISKW